MATKNIKTVKRPTGTNLDEYKNFREWTFEQWAWEFLRRNAKFIRACKAAGEDEAHQAEVASEFHLARFKSYKEGYGVGRRRPKFASSSVASWSWRAADEARQPRVRVRRGQVLLRFDLSATTDDAEALAAQLREAGRLLAKKQREYLAQSQLPEPKRASAKPLYFLRSLRLLDLLDGKDKRCRDPGHALRLLNEPPRSPMSDAEALEKHRKQIAQAREMSEHGYRHLANREGSPAPKSFAGDDNRAGS